MLLAYLKNNSNNNEKQCFLLFRSLFIVSVQFFPKLGVHSDLKRVWGSKKWNCNCRNSCLKVACISEEAAWFIEQMAQEGLLRETLDLVKSKKSD